MWSTTERKSCLQAMVCLINFKNVNLGLQCSCIRAAATVYWLGQAKEGGGDKRVWVAYFHTCIFNTKTTSITKEVVKG